MKMKDVVVCEKCFYRIAEASTKLAIMWATICKEFGQFNFVDLSELNEQALTAYRCLEILGHILTTEISENRLRMQILGDIHDCFCINVSDHVVDFEELDCE